jgi:hypothetical protein
MATDLRAYDLGHGILLDGVPSQTDAAHLQRFFDENGLVAALASDGQEGCQILLRGISRETYDWLRTGSTSPFRLPEIEKRIADSKAMIAHSRAIVDASKQLNRRTREGLDAYRKKKNVGE